MPIYLNCNRVDLFLINCIQLVKRIEMGDKEMNIVYKINNLPDCEHHSNPQHCLNRPHGSLRSELQ